MRGLILLVLALASGPVSAYGHGRGGHGHYGHPRGPHAGFGFRHYHPYLRYHGYGYGYLPGPAVGCPCGSAVVCYAPAGNAFCILPNGYRRYLPY